MESARTVYQALCWVIRHVAFTISSQVVIRLEFLPDRGDLSVTGKQLGLVRELGHPLQ